MQQLHAFDVLTGSLARAACLSVFGLLSFACSSASNNSSSGHDSGSVASSEDGGASTAGDSPSSAGDASQESNGRAGSNGSDSSGFDCTDSADPAKLLPVAAGDFVMGCDDAGCSDDEKPQHTVTLSAFEIDETEVTQAQYTACVLDGTCTAPHCAWSCDAGDLPAGCVTWEQANTYCHFAGKRLPSEAEWEKAARGENGNEFPWGDAAPDCTRANLEGCGGVAIPVASLDAGKSPYGAFDMAGNVVEYVADYYDPSYYQDSAASDPQGPESGTRYGGRGGGYKSTADWMRGAKRDWYAPSDAAPSLGFRCAR